FSPDSKRIISVSGDMTVRIWEVSSEALSNLACARYRHHLLLHVPEKITSDPSIIEASNRSKEVCKQYFPAWDTYRAKQKGFPSWVRNSIEWFLGQWKNA
ncbi:hypothetical protein ACSYAD_29600, partial [Acaryochloris marina NIES-2412]|uniref:hypothetical protein n=1 Tax=Acaryochloris marina TaxID=155978 RepID=UPI00405879AE